MRAPKFRPYDIIYDNDRWRVPGTREVYQAHVHEFNGVGHWELYYAPRPRVKPTFVFGALGDAFAVAFKKFYNQNGLVKVRTPKKDRVGVRLPVWGLTH